MSGLVGYASSDEGEEAPDHEASTTTTHIAAGVESTRLQDELSKPSVAAPPTDQPIAGPSFPPEELQGQEAVEDAYDDPSLSPYSANRAQIQALTMPRLPNFDIPRSPSPPAANSEEAADLTARTRKFERFLELKKQGVHFNDRLTSSTALRNPELLQKLADFAGISPEEQYENTLGEALAVPTRWPEGFLESLVASNQKKMRSDKEKRTKLDFVPASSKIRRS